MNKTTQRLHLNYLTNIQLKWDTVLEHPHNYFHRFKASKKVLSISPGMMVVPVFIRILTLWFSFLPFVEVLVSSQLGLTPSTKHLLVLFRWTHSTAASQGHLAPACTTSLVEAILYKLTCKRTVQQHCEHAQLSPARDLLSSSLRPKDFGPEDLWIYPTLCSAESGRVKCTALHKGFRQHHLCPSWVHLHLLLTFQIRIKSVLIVLGQETQWLAVSIFTALLFSALPSLVFNPKNFLTDYPHLEAAIEGRSLMKCLNPIYYHMDKKHMYGH